MKLCDRCKRVLASDTAAVVRGRHIDATFALCEPCASFVISALEGRHVWARGDDPSHGSDLAPAHETALAAVVVTLGRIANKAHLTGNRAAYLALRDTAEQIRNWVLGEVNAHELAAMTEATRRNLDTKGEANDSDT